MDKQKLRVFLFSNFPLKYLEKTILRKKYDNCYKKTRILLYRENLNKGKILYP